MWFILDRCKCRGHTAGHAKRLSCIKYNMHVLAWSVRHEISIGVMSSFPFPNMESCVYCLTVPIPEMVTASISSCTYHSTPVLTADQTQIVSWL